MSVALKLYEQLTEAGEDKTRAKLIAEAFEQVEERYPQLKDVATQSQLRETELRLQKEIREIDARIHEVEAKLQKEIRELDLKIAQLEVRLTQAIHRQTLWVIGSVGALIGGIRLLEWFLAHLPAN
jgi:chemotaxis response regulator CheB